MNTASFGTAGTYAAENLFAGDFPVVNKKVVVASGAGDLAAGSVLALNTDGKYVLVDSGAGTTGDIRRTPEGVLRFAANAASADAEAIMCLTGDFNRAALTFGGSDTAADHEAALRALSIFIHKTNQGA